MQFVRKADAERAIEKMQGFPIGGSRIRLSWGRSQCKTPPKSYTWEPSLLDRREAPET
jgi:RNA recognition motif-containing protein